MYLFCSTKNQVIYYHKSYYLRAENGHYKANLAIERKVFQSFTDGINKYILTC